MAVPLQMEQKTEIRQMLDMHLFLNVKNKMQENWQNVLSGLLITFNK